MAEGKVEIKDLLKDDGYSQEEKYFYELNKELAAKYRQRVARNAISGVNPDISTAPQVDVVKGSKKANSDKLKKISKWAP